MSYNFQSQSYHSTQAVVAACAQEWLRAGGDNDRATVLASLAANTDRELADELISDWDLDEPREDVMDLIDCTEDESTRMAEWDADYGDVVGAFAALRSEIMSEDAEAA